ncbi:MAG: universal stress protein [Cyclobacteriaceae bacterium]|nr:universal stress protein [Cyclobacteriaceae bacterium]
MKKILIPTDFTSNATNAMDFAFEIAKENNAKLYLLHVVEYPAGATVDPIGVSIVQSADIDLVEELTKSARKKLNIVKDNYQNAGVAVDISVDLGNPYLSIIEKVKDEEIDMIIMGTNGASGFKEFIVGSNAERVVRYADCPVMTIKEPINIQDVKNIVFASDFNHFSDELVMHLKKLQKTFDAQLHFVRVNTPNNFEKDRVSKKLIERTLQQHDFTNYTSTIYNDVYEEEGLIHFAQDIEADMIAMATHGRTGISHLISGSIAEDVVNHAKRPVWTFHLSKQ